jgi:hypothetical protein
MPARRRAVELAKLVAETDLTDCQALAGFAFDAAIATHTFATNKYAENAAFVQSFGIFVNANDASVVTANKYGMSISGSVEPVTMLPAGTEASGFASLYQEKLSRTNVDQVHHFSAFIQLGFFAAEPLATAAAWYLDGFNGNYGDLELSKQAIAIGRDLRSGAISARDVNKRIWDLCR